MVFGWVKSLILYLMLAGLAVNMAPSNQYKQYIRYFTGLVVIILLGRPIGYIFHLGSGELEEIVAGLSDSVDAVPVQDSTIYDYYDAGLRRGMLKELEPYGACDVEIITYDNGEIAQCKIYISCEESLFETNERMIKSLIWNVYNVELARIYVLRR